jgi:hypothetical protein
MHLLKDTTWHRVLNAQGACSTGPVVLPHDKQQRLLESEGVVFDKNFALRSAEVLVETKNRSQPAPELCTNGSLLSRPKEANDELRQQAKSTVRSQSSTLLSFHQMDHRF